MIGVIESGLVESIRMGEAVPFMVRKHKEFGDKRIESVGLVTGDNDQYFTHLHYPKPLGFATNERALLDNLVGKNAPVKAMLALDVSAAESGLGVILSRAPLIGRRQEVHEFFEHDCLVTPLNSGLVIYLSQRFLNEHALGRHRSALTEDHLQQLVMDCGRHTTINDEPYLYLPEPLEVGTYGTEESYYSNYLIIAELIRHNRMDGGDAIGDMHTHSSDEYGEASAYRKAMIDRFGMEYYTWPSAFDTLKFLGSRKEMEEILTVGTTTSCKRESAHLVMKGIVALTPHEDPQRRDLLGTSFLDIRAFTEGKEEERTQGRIRTLAERANSDQATLEDKIEYFDAVRKVVTKDLPDFVDTFVAESR